MDQSTMLINLFFQFTEKMLKEQYPEDKATIINEKFQNHFNEVIKKYNSKRILKSDAINPVFLIALNAAQQITSAELKEQMIYVYKNLLAEILITQNISLASSKDPWAEFVKSTKIANKQMYENEFFKCETVIDTDQQFGFNINRCVYYEVFKENGCEDLAPILCEYDYILADNIKDWVTFQRNETIAEGSKRCTFRYYKKTSS